jgi:hypothetical protein
MGATYLVYGAFALRARRKAAGCGCFGSVRPPSVLHIGLNLTAALACLLWIVAMRPT